MNTSDRNGFKVFAGRHSKELAQRVCTRLKVPLGDAKSFVFPDGELLVKLDEDVRGRDCYVVLSTCEPVNDNLMELLIFLDCLKRASAKRVTAVLPYFGYGRQDRKDEGRVPITAKLVANLITHARADRVLALDLHAAQIQGFFDLPMDHLQATPVFLDYFRSIRDELDDLCLVSPDVGNVKVAEKVANLLHGDLAIIHKQRLSGSQVVSANLIGSVEGKTVLMYDDMISTAGTVCEAAKLVMARGAKRVIAAATHAVLVGPAMDRLRAAPISRIVVTDTVPIGDRCAPIRDRLTVLSVGDLLGDAIHNIHHNLSISALFRDKVGPKR
ncbi:MAG: ribose-phosphate pyrophosphokinase [Phycisphaerales bacterium]|nr:ribose-phosphate pyrophosphokinase [Phycisphaerales bacterium]